MKKRNQDLKTKISELREMDRERLGYFYRVAVNANYFNIGVHYTGETKQIVERKRNLGLSLSKKVEKVCSERGYDMDEFRREFL